MEIEIYECLKQVEIKDNVLFSVQYSDIALTYTYQPNYYNWFLKYYCTLKKYFVQTFLVVFPLGNSTI